MRAFIAVDPPKEVQGYLSELQGKFRNLIMASFPKSFHLTLKFLGEINNPEEVVEKLEKIKFRELLLELDCIGVFPKPNNPRVLWAGLKENPELMKLAKDVETVLGKNDKPFKAHLTLARIKLLKEKERFRELLEKTELKQLSFIAKEFVLYRSTLLPEGPVYEKIKAFKAEQKHKLLLQKKPL